MHGQTGAGKSTLAGYLQHQVKGTLIRISDINRTLSIDVNMWPESDSDNSPKSHLRSYAELFAKAESAADDSPMPVILDAAFPQRSLRKTLYEFAATSGRAIALVEVGCKNQDVRSNRIAHRTVNSPSKSTAEATNPKVAEWIQQIWQPLSRLERRCLDQYQFVDNTTTSEGELEIAARELARKFLT